MEKGVDWEKQVTYVPETCCASKTKCRNVANFQPRFRNTLISAFHMTKNLLRSVCNVFEKTNRISYAFSFYCFCFFPALSLPSAAAVFVRCFTFPLQFEIMSCTSLLDLSRNWQVVGVSRWEFWIQSGIIIVINNNTSIALVRLCRRQ